MQRRSQSLGPSLPLPTAWPVPRLEPRYRGGAGSRCLGDASPQKVFFRGYLSVI